MIANVIKPYIKTFTTRLINGMGFGFGMGLSWKIQDNF